MNKILLTLLLTFTLSACALYPQKFDNNEYSMLVNFVVATEQLRENCKGDGEVVKGLLPGLQRNSRALELYTQYTPRNEEVFNVARILRGDVQEFAAHYKRKGHNKAYCEIKTDLMLKKAKRILEAAGKKPRN